jgi:hypothetical protein
MMDGIVATAGLHRQGKKAERSTCSKRPSLGPTIAACWTSAYQARSSRWSRTQTPSYPGDRRGPGFPEGYALLRQWLPEAEGFVLPGATHALQIENPSGMADALRTFLARHPMAVPA